MLGPLRSLSLWPHRHRPADPFLPSALLARQQPVDAEAAASGHERENEAAHNREVLIEVVVLRTACGCFGVVRYWREAPQHDAGTERYLTRSLVRREYNDRNGTCAILNELCSLPLDFESMFRAGIKILLQQSTRTSGFRGGWGLASTGRPRAAIIP
jgi:hypothetical protein